MHSHLVVMIFEGENEASRVHDALQRMRAGLLLNLEHTAIVSSDRQGGVSVTQKRELTSVRAGPNRDLAGSAASVLLGDVPDELVQSLVNEGFDDRFREQIIQAFPDNSSALLFLASHDSGFDRGRLFGILSLFNGDIFETTLPRAAEAVLAQGWEA
jgi:uncharacterized membrane protein